MLLWRGALALPVSYIFRCQMPLATLLRRFIRPSRRPDQPILRDELTVAGDRLTFQRAGRSPVSLRPRDIVAISYDYNPFGCMHANSLRSVYVQHSERAFIEVYDEKH